MINLLNEIFFRKRQFVRKSDNRVRVSFELLRNYFRLLFSILYLVIIHISMKF